MKTSKSIKSAAALAAVLGMAAFFCIGCGGGDNGANPTTFTVTADAAPQVGGTVVPTPPGPYKAGAQVKLTPVANDGYAFSKWEGDTTGTQNPITVTVNKDMTVYAIFERTGTPPTGVTRFTVTFDTDGGTPDTITPVVIDSGAALGASFPPDPEKPDYNFDGWFSGDTRYTAATVITKAVTLTAKWEAAPPPPPPGAAKFTVTFDTDGGTPAKITPAEVDSGAALGSALPSAPTKSDYTFDGWFSGDTRYTAATVITKDVKLTAKWEAVSTPVTQFTVTFDTDGGTPGTITPAEVDSGAALGSALPSDPTKSDYTFAGWFSGSTQYTASTAINEDVTLKAKWEAVSTNVTQFAVTFITNGGTPPAITPLLVDSGAAPGASFPPDPAMTGYTFEGWFSGNTKYTSATVITASVTVTAKWEAVPPTVKQFTVTFDTDGGAPAITTVDVDSGASLGLSKFPPAPSKTDYSFDGWFSGNTQYHSTTVITADVTLKAKWGAIDVPLTAPSSVAATAESTDSITVRWNSVTGAVGYYIYRSATAAGTYDSIGMSATTVFGNAGLSVGTRYYYKVAAYNAGGKGPQSSYAFTVTNAGGEDVDSISYGGQTYKTVRIGTQRWMAENLNYKLTDRAAADTGVCYGNNPDSCARYGRLYDWASAMNLDASYNSANAASQLQEPHQGACPVGWHIPSSEEWSILFTSVGGISTAGKKLKATDGWQNDNNGTDDYGFSALPSSGNSGGGFNPTGSYGSWWSTTQYENHSAWRRIISTGNDVKNERSGKGTLFSVRCVKN